MYSTNDCSRADGAGDDARSQEGNGLSIGAIVGIVLVVVIVVVIVVFVPAVRKR